MDELDAFGNDYIYFSEAYLTPERSEREVDLIVEILKLRPDMHVLDLCCGTGRIANRLAKRHISVVGIDNNSVALEIAKLEAKRFGLDMEYIDADIFSGWTGQYDAIISWYTSFGLADDNLNRQILKNAFDSLKPGGQILIEHINRDVSLKNLREWMVHERNEDCMIDHNRYDVLSGRMLITRTFRRMNSIRSVNYTIRLFTFTELAYWLQSVGFKNVQAFSPEGHEFSLTSPRMLIVAKKIS